MLGVKSDSVFCGFLCPLEMRLQKGLEGGEVAAWPPGLWCPLPETFFKILCYLEPPSTSTGLSYLPR